ncbi:MFS transporter [Pseudonocardia parietis]|uniref:MFS family permease n=1 Tax=Pseudonocardia parietis TaxID=570936 RepID=A0ABS4VLI3_9PSEU|nr:MFS transporter [Pseudonocardia parietis]MBP2364464.1 MFS family permease [Pseudonocardia parietis]
MGYDVDVGHRRADLLAARRQRAAIAVVQVLGLAVWFSVSAVVPSLRQDWGVSTAGAVWLTGSTQVGFVVGAIASAVLNLADRIAANVVLAVSAASAALCTVVLALFVDGMGGAIPLRFLTGVCLAGVYPVGMKLMASWAPSAGRGLALGMLIGALTLGSTMPQLISGLGDLPWPTVLLVASALGLLGALVALLVVRPGPHLAGRCAPHPRYALTMFTQRDPLLVNLGYFGHMWELYALWTWLPTFLLVSPAADQLPGSVGLVVFATMGIVGVVGCLLGGLGADRFGRPQAAAAALIVSGACCLLSPVAFHAGPAVLIVFCAVWGASVIADSGVFSTSLSETADPRFIGTALTAQTAIGFALTVLSIQLVPLLADAVGWQYAFLILVPGPVLGARAMRAFGARTTDHASTSGKEA